MPPKIQRIYKYNVVSLNCDHTTFYQDIPDNYSFAQFGNSKVNIQKGKGLHSNKCMWLFFLLTLFHRLSWESAYILQNQEFQQRYIELISMVLFFFSSPRGNWFTGRKNTLHHRLTTQTGTDAVRLPYCADVKSEGCMALYSHRSAPISHIFMAWDSCLIIYNSNCIFLNFQNEVCSYKHSSQRSKAGRSHGSLLGGACSLGASPSGSFGDAGSSTSI